MSKKKSARKAGPIVPRSGPISYSGAGFHSPKKYRHLRKKPKTRDLME